MAERETLILAPIVQRLRESGVQVREELPVVLRAETVTADIVTTHSGGADVYEGKVAGVADRLVTHLGQELIAQCLRWRGLATCIWAVTVEPRHENCMISRQKAVLSGNGIGLIYVHHTLDGFDVAIEPVKDESANPSRLFHAMEHSGVATKPAGSASPGRSLPMYDEANDFLLENGAAEWKLIRRFCPGLRSVTPHAARRDIDRGRWKGARYSESPGGITVFHRAEE